MGGRRGRFGEWRLTAVLFACLACWKDSEGGSQAPLLAARFVILSPRDQWGGDGEEARWPCLESVADWKLWHLCGRHALEQASVDYANREHWTAIALRMMTTALRLHRHTADAHWDIGVIYAQVGNRTSAGYAMYHSSKALEFGAPKEVWLNIASILDDIPSNSRRNFKLASSSGSSSPSTARPSISIGPLLALRSYIDLACPPNDSCRGAHIRTAVAELWRACQFQCGCWDTYAEDISLYRALIQMEIKSCSKHDGVASESLLLRLSPWDLITSPLSPSETLLLTRCIANSYPRVPSELLPPALRPPVRLHERRLVVGYLSTHFTKTTFNGLINDVITNHDRSSFEIVAFAWNRQDPNGGKGDDQDSILVDEDSASGGARLVIFEAGRSEEEWAKTINSEGVHVLIDLLGWLPVGVTHGSPTVLAHRPAGVVLHCEGFHASTGAAFVHHTLLDIIAAPPEYTPHFSEAPIYVPASLHVNSHATQYQQVTIADAMPSPGSTDDVVRVMAPHAFFKLYPTLFESWLDIVDGTAAELVLAGSKAHALDAIDQIRIFESAWRESRKRRGKGSSGSTEDRTVESSELVRLKSVVAVMDGTDTREEYLRQLCQGSLFLDTPLFNAHTTAVDAIWAGLPLVTTPTERMAGRMAASILWGGGLELLIARNSEEYTSLARRLTVSKRKREAVRWKVVHCRDGLRADSGASTRRVTDDEGLPERENDATSKGRGRGLFDTKGWVRALEKGALGAWEAFVCCDHRGSGDEARGSSAAGRRFAVIVSDSQPDARAFQR